MPVYIDHAIYRIGKPRVCRMAADTVEELVSMLASMGLRKSRIWKKPPFPYAQLCKIERERAIELGAIEVSRRALSNAMVTLQQQHAQQTQAWQGISSSACDAAQTP